MTFRRSLRLRTGMITAPEHRALSFRSTHYQRGKILSCAAQRARRGQNTLPTRLYLLAQCRNVRRFGPRLIRTYTEIFFVKNATISSIDSGVSKLCSEPSTFAFVGSYPLYNTRIGNPGFSSLILVTRDTLLDSGTEWQRNTRSKEFAPSIKLSASSSFRAVATR